MSYGAPYGGDLREADVFPGVYSVLSTDRS